jgi:ADP-heptose:LPS heptosyltransferase
MLDFLKKFRGNEFDRLLQSAVKGNKKRFLIVWNRGLGDIALGLYALVYRIRTFIPDAQITFITRKELEDAFLLLDNTSVIGVPWWERGKPIDFDNTLNGLNIKKTDYDIFLEKVNPTKWLSWQIEKLTPKLKWKNEYDELWKHFNFLESSRSYIGVHLNTETGQFYGYQKDWPVGNWRALFERLSEIKDIQIVLFGHNRTGTFNLPSVIDLRGDTTLLEMLSIIKNRCNVLIAPDGGVLSLIYYLDVFSPITVISLWGDANQGILKQAVPSPNKGLVHMPIIGKGNDISNISVEEVFSKITIQQEKQ